MEYIANIAINFVIILFLVIMYTYLTKLESIGCECSVHPYRDMIKSYTIFALAIVVIISLVPTTTIGSMFGNTMAIIYTILKLIFYTTCIVYFYMVLVYTRFLVNEKCRCSDDIRREILTGGAIIEIIVLFMVLLMVIILPIIFGSIIYISNNYEKLEKEMSTSLTKPLRTLRKLPSKISSSKGLMKSSKDVFKKMRSSK